MMWQGFLNLLSADLVEVNEGRAMMSMSFVMGWNSIRRTLSTLGDSAIKPRSGAHSPLRDILASNSTMRKST